MKNFRIINSVFSFYWGLYAMLATGEWTMTNNNLN